MLVGEELMGLRGDRGLDHRQHARFCAGDPLGQRRPEGEVAAAARRGADPLLVRSHGRIPARTSPASGRPRSATATSTSSTARRCSSRTPVTPTGWSSSHRRIRARATRPVRVRRTDRSRRRRRRETPGQDGSARHRHVRHRVRRRQGARRKPARRGGRGLQDRHEDARFHLPGHSSRRRRGRTGRVRLLGRVPAKTRVQFGSRSP